jgi:L-cysteine/cystine lyase
MDAAAFRAEFPVLERTAYLNAGSDGPLPAAAVEAGQDALAAQGADGRTYAHFQARIAAGDALRRIYAGLLGCETGELAMTTSTSEGLGKVLTGLGLEPGDEVLTSDQEHPGLLGPLLAARARGVRIRTGPLATLADHVTTDTTVVCCSHVGWLSGELADPRLGATGVPLVLDGAQGVGAVPVDVRALGCVAYAGAGQKWLCGADGTGMLFVDAAWSGRIAASAPAYLAFTEPAAGLGSDLHDDARRHDTPTLAREVVEVSVAAARVLERFGWEALHARATGLAATLASALAERGRTVGPRGPTTLVAWEDADPPATVARLAERGVVIRHLPGTAYVRASIGAWNDESDLDRLLEAL